MNVREILIIALFVAIAVTIQLGKNYAFPGVELTTLTVFLAGAGFGWKIGLLVGLIVPLTYSFFLGFHPVMLFVISAYAVLGATAGFVKTKKRLFLGVIGFVFALLFDIWTNFGFALTFKVPLEVAFLNPLTIQIMLVHQLMNALLFGLSGPTLLKVVKERGKLK